MFFFDRTYILYGSFSVLDEQHFKLSYRYMVDAAAYFQDRRNVLEAILFFVSFASECAKLVFDRDGRFLLCLSRNAHLPSSYRPCAKESGAPQLLSYCVCLPFVRLSFYLSCVRNKLNLCCKDSRLSLPENFMFQQQDNSTWH